MSRINQTKAKLQQGQPVFGVIGSTNDPQIVEILGLTGFDYYMVDGEHGLIDPTQAENIVRACEVTGMTPLVRLGPKDPKLVLQYLDAGFMGVMMPGLETVAEIEMLVNAVKYPPLGKRGLGLGRAANFMLGSGADQANYVRQANEQTMVLPQFEDAAILQLLPQMVQIQIPGVDGFVFGPRDLSLTMGYPDGPNHPEVQAVIDEAIAIMQDAGCWVGITAGTAVAAQQQIQRGAQIILNSVPNLLKQSAANFLD
ncbi:HpcH/HpaI aldolase family protein [Candidatus Leptofilum sp.]|uniref:HpcH/HpaI aldolase family protein n=1 Tax=Candidatus Leptofilum sp. TaxID=3241576 RepID=UPI003B596700